MAQEGRPEVSRKEGLFRPTAVVAAGLLALGMFVLGRLSAGETTGAGPGSSGSQQSPPPPVTTSSPTPSVPGLRGKRGLWVNFGGRVISADLDSVVIDVNRPADPPGRRLVTVRNILWGSKSNHPPSLPPANGTSVCATAFATATGVGSGEFDFGKVLLGECTIRVTGG